MILFLAEHVHSCKYGTFFFNSEQERNNKKVREETVSIWMEVGFRMNTDFRNPYYRDSL